eukprot:GFKZ01013818.1.p1 GENE.GFKZ01013818.1~~GFKZ01013818.1.p1  ORF type:complete len:331 (+),score=26.19 GFKZ01013818.1:219-1211(+)
MSPGMLDSAPIRALTLFSPGVPALAPLQTLARSLYTALQPHPVETTRLSLPSPSVFPTPSACLHFTQAQTPPSPPFTHLSLGTIHPHTPAPFRSLEFILSLLSSPTTFLSISLNHPDGSIHTPSVSLAAQLIHHLSRSGEPLSNLRFAALANMPPACPFLPASYAPIDPSLCIPSLGVSIAPLIPPTITDTRPILESLAQSLQQKCHPISPVALDFSLAPEIGGGVSSIDVLRRISGGELFQGGGWVAAAGLVAAQLASVKAERKVGFWGVMMPVLEDRQLANLSGIMPLLAVSAVCGTGLDVSRVPSFHSWAWLCRRRGLAHKVVCKVV